MSATKRRNLKKKIIGCLCLAAIAASMTAAPFVPVVSDVSVISASAETLQANVDLSQLASYADVPDLGFTVMYYSYLNFYEIQLKDGYDYTFTGTNSADVQIYVPGGVTASINFNNATIINDDGEYSTTAYSGYLQLDDECCINNTVKPFYVDGNLTVSGTLSVDTYSYYGDCSVYPNVHGISVPLNAGNGSFNVSSFFTVKYLDENGISIDERYYLGGNTYNVTTPQNIKDNFPCVPSTVGLVSADKTVTARTTHIDEGIDGVCDNCGAAVERTVTFETNGGSTITSATVTNGQKLTAPTAPTKTDCTFAGWYTDSALTTPYDFTSAVTSDITLYAKWRVEVEVDLSRIVDYTSSAPTGVTAAYGDYDNNIIELKLADGNYKFKGTNLVSGAYVDVKIIVPTGVTASIEFAEGSSIINDSGVYALTNGTYSEHNLANYCNINDYAVPFKVEAGGSLTVSGSLSVDTYSYYGECGDGDAHPAGHQWTAPLNEGSGTFTANFFIVKYVDENNKVIDQNFYLSGKTYTINTLPKTNFPKYYNGMNQYDPNDQASIGDFPCLSFTGGTVSADKEVIARTTHIDEGLDGACDNCGVAIERTVTFETNGGSTIASAAVTNGQTLAAPTAPTKTGFTFAGWYTDAECTIPYNFTSAVTSDITLYAKWDDRTLDSISIAAAPTKTSYIEGASFDPTGLKLTLTYDNGETDAVTYSAGNASLFTFSPSGALSTSDTSVTITYGGKTTTQNITVAEKTLDSISVAAAPTKTSYIEGTSFDPTGLKLTLTYDNGETETVTYSAGNASLFTFSPSGALSTSDTSVTITYGGKTTTQNITVAEKTLDSISVAAAPTKTSYSAGKIFDPTGLKLTLTYDNGETETVTYSAGNASLFTFSPSGELSLSDTSVTITYGGKTTTQNITVAEKTLDSISVAAAPTKTIYFDGAKFDPAGLKLTLTYDNGETETVTYSTENASLFTFSPIRALSTSDTSVTITYDGKTTTQAITVKAVNIPNPNPNPNPNPKPNTGTSTINSIKEPSIKSENGKSGWGAISDKISETPEGGKVTVNMNGTTELPKNILKDIKGKDIDLVLDMGGGITWTINGKDVTNPKTVNLGVKTNTNKIPVSIINNVTGEKYSLQISLEYDGDFGFTATLTIDLGKRNDGLYANLFYYNPKTKELEFMDYGKISDGKAELIFTHASDWAIVIDKEPLGEADDVSSAAGITAAGNIADAADKPAVFVIPVMAAAAIGTAVIVRKKARK